MPTGEKAKAEAAARRKGVRDLYIQGLGVPEIAKYFDVSRPTIYNDLKVLGIQSEKSGCTDERRKAMSEGMKKRREQELVNYKIKPVCCVCGKLADRKQYRKKNYCDEHLITAGDYDPDYEERQRIERRKEIPNG